ncbi:MAG: MBL fold metallo-hydrolase [Actinomycetota bacterium]|nr:MBL fold metallo-hydrolase [Actinomycetota bacterium]
MPEIVTIETPGLGDRSYVVHDGRSAAVIDPHRDIDRVLDVVASRQLMVTHVLETHLHNDYVTGGLALARRCGAEYVVPGGDQVSFDRIAVVDGDRIRAGLLELTALHTPGHTPHHMSYAVSDELGRPQAVFTGGSMLYGAVGRTDLISRDRTDELSRAQYRSVRRLVAELPDHVSVHPTHGFGSFCSATQTSGEESTIGQERAQNLALVTEDEDRFVDELMSGLTAYPSYYVHMGARNAAGPGEPDMSLPELVDPQVLRDRISGGEWVVDLRQRRAFAQRHLSGTVSIELGDPFATYLGWTVPWSVPLTLIGDSTDQVLEARRQLVRIGVDALAGAYTAGLHTLPDGHLSDYPVASFEDLGGSLGDDDVVILDVRRADEWAEGHLVGAVHIPFWELAARVEEVPEGRVWVHCATGFRAAIGASIAERAGRRVVHIDDDWQRVGQLGLPVEPA